MPNKEHKVEVVEDYGDYVPPFPVKDLVSDLLGGISSHYLRGLQTVLLRNSEALNRKGRRQKIPGTKHKVAIVNCGGLYYQRWYNKPATIVLFVDKIIAQYPAWLFKLRITRRVVFSNTMFHELGHHIHATQSPEYKEKECVADDWGKRLSREYIRYRYGYLKLFKPLIRIASTIIRVMSKISTYYAEGKYERK